MGLIPQVKCNRCDRSYSGLRSRCPYCGAHRHKQGKRVTDSDNATWKLIIGILLIVVLITAVVVILVTSSGDKEPAENNGDKDITHSDGVDSQDGKNPTGDEGDDGQGNGDEPGPADGQPGADDPQDGNGGEPVTPGGPTDGSEPQDTTVIATDIKANTRYQKPAVDFTLKPNESVEATAVITPSNATGVPVWTSDDPSVVDVVPTDETGIKATITWTGKGSTKVRVTLDQLEWAFDVRCN